MTFSFKFHLRNPAHFSGYNLLQISTGSLCPPSKNPTAGSRSDARSGIHGYCITYKHILSEPLREPDNHNAGAVYAAFDK